MCIELSAERQFNGKRAKLEKCLICSEAERERERERELANEHKERTSERMLKKQDVMLKILQFVLFFSPN